MAKQHISIELVGNLQRLEAKAGRSLRAAARCRYQQGMIDVLNERRRQVTVEGFVPEADDGYTAGELSRAAAAYAIVGIQHRDAGRVTGLLAELWPWAKVWWKPRDARSNKVRAAALLIADIERLDRAATKGAS